jgi:hypothetical protein
MSVSFFVCVNVKKIWEKILVCLPPWKIPLLPNSNCCCYLTTFNSNGYFCFHFDCYLSDPISIAPSTRIAAIDLTTFNSNCYLCEMLLLTTRMANFAFNWNCYLSDPISIAPSTQIAAIDLTTFNLNCYLCEMLLLTTRMANFAFNWNCYIWGHYTYWMIVDKIDWT